VGTKKSKYKDNVKDNGFNQYFLFSSFPNVKAGFWATIILFGVSSLIHHFYFPGSMINKYLDQSIVVFPFIFFTLIAIYFKVFHKWLLWIFVTLNILSIAAIFLMGASSDITSPGYQYFLPWTMLMMMGTFIFYRIPSIFLLIICLLMVAGIIISMVVNQTLSDQPEIFLSNVSFVISMASLGYFIIVHRSYITKRLYMSEQESRKINEALQMEIHEREIKDATLNESEKNYRNLLESMPDWIHVIDRNYRFILINSAFREVNKSLGLETNVIGKHITEVFSFIPPQRLADYEHVFQTGEVFIVEEMVQVNGREFFTETRLIPIFKDAHVEQMITGIRDIGKKKEIELLRHKNAEQKELLLREIHHRVKNNLAIVISLVDMQIRENDNPEFLRLSNDIKLRIRSMAVIHEHLYKSEELDKISFCAYLNSLIRIISSTYSGQNIKVTSRCDSTEIPLERAMSLGLIVNEILTNAYKYAFPDQQKGEITIDLKEIDPEKGLNRLKIHDNGIGLPVKFTKEDEASLGILIIRLLSKQIEADLTIKNHEGTTYTMIFHAIPSNKNK
jgi:PAS domain S-box-containing protein